MQATKQTDRYPVLDALRFVLVFWVAVGHYGMFPLFAAVNESVKFGHFLVHAWNTIVSGTPAVLCFFVISGFCIHLPYRGEGSAGNQIDQPVNPRLETVACQSGSATLISAEYKQYCRRQNSSRFSHDM